MNAISNASGSSMLRRPSAASILLGVARASRSARLRATASRFAGAFGPVWVMMDDKVSSSCCLVWGSRVAVVFQHLGDPLELHERSLLIRILLVHVCECKALIDIALCLVVGHAGEK